MSWVFTACTARTEFLQFHTAPIFFRCSSTWVASIAISFFIGELRQRRQADKDAASNPHGAQKKQKQHALMSELSALALRQALKEQLFYHLNSAGYDHAFGMKEGGNSEVGCLGSSRSPFDRLSRNSFFII